MSGNEVLDFIEQLDSLTTIEATWAFFLCFARTFGFTHGRLADMPGPHERIEDTTLCLSWPEEWRQRYFENNYIAEDPDNLYLQRSHTPFTWEEMLATQSYTKQQRRIVSEASEF